ncbi:swr complex subunit [Knufia obscura]|uniref:SWR1-complex protein 5 n=2 Tax=Knufia TaxID=430999 RepID=A0AAN8EJ17_9EURO|nr:swr complex subunit [Knufia obscura]KAK5950700.1 swr complex subunit [Knufia fluminis]
MATEESNPDITDDGYDEEADSDFDEHVSDAGSASSSAEEEAVATNKAKPGKKSPSSPPLVEELDSGDEVTIKERQKSRRKQKRRKDGQVSSDDEQKEEWRAKTRSMRVQEQAERQKKALVSIKTSTIDVNSIWEEMNRPGPLPPIRIEGQPEESPAKDAQPVQQEGQKESDAGGSQAEEMITIKRRYKFAGEMHTVEKSVSKSSAEAKLWLEQQENMKATSEDTNSSKQRPVRKISRFDPNYSNLEAFRNHSIKAQPEAFNGPKLNVVEKSKMDWAAHVDKEGLKDELEVHAKAKDAYMNRMDFLSKVGQRQDDEARAARQIG